MKIDEIFKKLKDNYINKINVRNETKHFDIDIKRYGEEVYFLFNNFPLDLYEYIPKSIRLEGSPRGGKTIKSNRELSDLEQSFFKFVEWLLEEEKTVIFTS